MKHPGSVGQQGGAASPLAQQLLGIVCVLLVVLLIVVLDNTGWSFFQVKKQGGRHCVEDKGRYSYKALRVKLTGSG